MHEALTIINWCGQCPDIQTAVPAAPFHENLRPLCASCSNTCASSASRTHATIPLDCVISGLRHPLDCVVLGGRALVLLVTHHKAVELVREFTNKGEGGGQPPVQLQHVQHPIYFGNILWISGWPRGGE